MGKASRRKREHRERPRMERRTVPLGDLRVEPGQLGPDPFITVGGEVAYPMEPDANGDLHMEELPLNIRRANDQLTMSTPMVINLTLLARRQEWCTKALDDDLLRRLDPSGVHVIVTAWKHTTEDWKRQNVRAHMMLKLRDQTEGYMKVADFPSHQFGIFLGTMRAAVVGASRRILMPEGEVEWEKPNWAAARSFPKVWDACQDLFALNNGRELYGDLHEGELLNQGYTPASAKELAGVAKTARAVFGATALNALNDAKLIVAETEWAQAIDDKRPDQATLTNFAKTARLPFDTVYLDFEGPGGNLVSVPVPDPKAASESVYKLVSVGRLAGAIMYRDGEDGPLNIIPVASPRRDEDPRMSYEPAGRVVMHAPDAASDVGLASVFIDGHDSNVRMAVVRPGVIHQDAAPGRIELPHPEPDGMVTIDEDGAAAKLLAAFVHATAMRALRVLYMLQAGNVELVEAKLHPEGKRRLKRSEKRGWPVEIGLMVAVRWKKKLYFRPPGSDQVGDGDGRGYSHAFWVSGHPVYYPLGTRMADSLIERDPGHDSIVIDPTAEKKGIYRMIYCPPYVKGLYDPETGVEREPVDKTRKIVGGLPNG